MYNYIFAKSDILIGVCMLKLSRSLLKIVRSIPYYHKWPFISSLYSNTFYQLLRLVKLSILHLRDCVALIHFFHLLVFWGFPYRFRSKNWCFSESIRFSITKVPLRILWERSSKFFLSSGSFKVFYTFIWTPNKRWNWRNCRKWSWVQVGVMAWELSRLECCNGIQRSWVEAYYFIHFNV